MIPLDKQLHFYSGGMLAALAWPFGVVLALLIVVVAAIGKEVRDSMGYGTPDAWDAVATILGGSVVISWLSLF